MDVSRLVSMRQRCSVTWAMKQGYLLSGVVALSAQVIWPQVRTSVRTKAVINILNAKFTLTNLLGLSCCGICLSTCAMPLNQLGWDSRLLRHQPGLHRAGRWILVPSDAKHGPYGYWPYGCGQFFGTTIPQPYRYDHNHIVIRTVSYWIACVLEYSLYSLKASYVEKWLLKKVLLI